MILTSLSLLLLHSSTLLSSPLHRSLIQRRQLLDGIARSGGVAPKPPGSSASDSSFQPSSSLPWLTSFTTTTMMVLLNDKADERSMKETNESQSKSKAGLIAAIAAPTGILGIVGAAIGAFLYKKNQSNSSNNAGFLSQFFNTNATRQRSTPSS